MCEALATEMQAEMQGEMPEDLPHEPRTLTALGERVAVVETQQKSLKEDTTVIRSTLHGVANEMQKFVLAEQRCGEHLAKIVEQTQGLPGIASSVSIFNEMRPKLEDLLAQRQQQTGAWKTLATIASIFMGLVTLSGVVAGAIVYFASHWK